MHNSRNRCILGMGLQAALPPDALCRAPYSKANLLALSYKASVRHAQGIIAVAEVFASLYDGAILLIRLV